jgi:tetratricopeptide (TPR) repeat protein
MTHRIATLLLTVLLLCACCVEARPQAAPQINQPQADPPTAKPAPPTPPALEKAAPDAPVPDLGTLPKASEKPNKTVTGRIARKLKDAAPRCLDAIVHTCWAQPAADGPATEKTAEERAYVRDLEIADFYLKSKNYQGAAMRYRDALGEKPEDPEATFKLAKALERLGEKDGARCTYQDFLKVGSSTPFTEEARKALGRLGSGGDRTCPTDKSNVR